MIRRLARLVKHAPVAVDSGEVSRVRSLLADGRQRRARAITEDLAGRQDAGFETDVCRALIALNGSLPDAAWELFERHELAAVLSVAPVELVRAGTPAHLDEVTAVLTAKARTSRSWRLEADDALAVARELAAAGETAVARMMLTHTGPSAGQPGQRYSLLRDRLIDEESGPTGSDRAGAAFVLWDHQDLDRSRSPRSLAPFVDSLLDVAKLARSARLSSQDRDAESFLRSWEPPEGDPASAGLREVQLWPVLREFSHLSAVPDGTWALVSGDLVRRSAMREARFPFDARIRPVYTDVHVDPAVLAKPGATQHLRDCAPIGCRDWNSVFVLRAADVPAFFAGSPVPAGALVDSNPRGAAPDGTETDGGRVSWSDAAAGARTLGENLRAAQRAAARVGTASGPRLTIANPRAYWVARAAGREVSLRLPPKAPAHDCEPSMSDARLGELQQAAERRTDQVVSAIVGGADESQVRQLWREACDGAVRAADEKARSLPPLAPLAWSIDAACTSVRRRAVSRPRSAPAGGSEVLVEVSLDGRLKSQLPVVLNSMVGNSSRPIHLHVLCRDHGGSDFDRLAALFPEVSFTWLPTDDVDYGPIGGMLGHITVASMDRLLLPSLLPDVRRIIHHDLDAVTRADLAELFDFELDGAPLAARDQLQPNGGSLYRSWAGQAERLFRSSPELGSEMLLRLAGRHAFDQAVFNSGVMVMDLDTMRRDGFLVNFLPWVARYGLNDQVLLNAYAASTRAELPYEWNHYPRIEPPLRDPKIVHWIGSQKPWAVPQVAGQAYWREAEEALTNRRRTARHPRHSP